MKKNILTKLKKELLAEATLKERVYWTTLNMCGLIFLLLIFPCLTQLDQAIVGNEHIDPYFTAFLWFIPFISIFIIVMLAMGIGRYISEMETESSVRDRDIDDKVAQIRARR